MKSMDYFEAGLPIINNIKGDTWDFVDKNNLGINLSSYIDYNLFKNYDVKLRNVVRNFYEENFSIEKFEKSINKILNLNKHK